MPPLSLHRSSLGAFTIDEQNSARCDSFYVTHELLAYRLGVRREGITEAAISLKRSRLIDYHRGNITVLDRSGLESAACGCYSTDRLAYDNLMA